MDETLSETLRRVDALGIDPGAAVAGASASAADLRRLVEDRSAGAADRRAAFLSLSERLQGEAELSEVVLALVDDPDEALAREAIAAAPPFDARVVALLRDRLDSPRPSTWEACALALARKKNRAILPRMLAWARSGDAPHRRVGLAAVAFLLIPEEHLAVVEGICEDGPRDDDDEAVLVDALRVAEARVAFWRKTLGEEEP